jgi:lipopolysaccharide assembly protein A
VNYGGKGFPGRVINMQIFIILALLIAGVAVIFALQNITTVTVTFFIWSIHGSLALILLASVAVGVLISLLASLPGLVRGSWTIGSHKRKLSNLQNERGDYQRRAEEAEKEVKDLEEQLASLSAELAEIHSKAEDSSQIEQP